MSRSRRRKGFQSAAWEEIGGYMEAKKRKLNKQFSESDKMDESLTPISSIFSGITIYVNGYTTPTADELKKMMKLHGGNYAYFYSKTNVTHMIANQLAGAKISDLKHQKIVQPQWIVDSIEAGKLLSVDHYLLYTNRSEAQPGLTFQTSPKEKLPNAAADDEGDDDDDDEDIEDVIDDDCEASPEQKSPSKSVCVRSVRHTTDASFVSDFYSNSRLHYLSTWGAEFRDYVATLYAKRKRTICPKPSPLRNDLRRLRRTIMHIDMDCFFVSVSLRNRADLKGKPVAVCHAQNTKKKIEKERGGGGESYSEIASCSYEAREAGVRNGMFVGRALELCPNLITVPYDFVQYRETSQVLYDTLASYTLEIEAVSCDEAYVDVTDLMLDTDDDDDDASTAHESLPRRLAAKIRQQVFEKTHCCASVGIGANILLARMATRKAKPDGIYEVKAEIADDFMTCQPVSALPGVGYVAKKKLKEANIETCADLKAKSLAWLQEEFGIKSGKALHEYCRGIDDRSLKIVRERKSLSAEINYGIRLNNMAQVEIFLTNLSKEVQRRLNNAAVKGKTLTLKIKVKASDAPKEPRKFLGHGHCDNRSKSVNFVEASSDSARIAQESLKLVRQLGVSADDIRGMGIQMSKLVSTEQQSSTAQRREKGQKAIFEYTTTTTTTTTDEEEKTIEKEKSPPSLRTIRRSPVKRLLLFKSKPVAQPPQLPFLPSLSQAAAAAAATAATAATANSTNKDEWNESLDVPSSSQIDHSVLEALPEELQSKIRKVSKRKAVDRGNKCSANETSLAKAKPIEPVQALPPLSEIDPECLNALPSAVRKEILSAYKKREPVARLGKVPVSEPKRNETNDTEESVEKKKPTLLGVDQLADVQKVICDWLSSTEDPEEVDVDVFNEYLEELMDQWNLETIVTLLRYFKRRISSRHESWEPAFATIVDSIQKKSKVKLGGTLQL